MQAHPAIHAIRAIPTPNVWNNRRNQIIIGIATFVSLMLALRDHVQIDPGAILAFGYLAVFIVPLIGSLTLLLPVPALPIIFLAGGILDPFATALVAAAGMTIGMAATYFAAASNQNTVRNSIANRTGFTGRWARKIFESYEHHPALASFAMSAFSGPAFAFSGIVAGAAGISARTYFAYTLLGRFVFALPLALAGKYTAETIQNLGWITL